MTAGPMIDWLHLLLPLSRDFVDVVQSTDSNGQGIGALKASAIADLSDRPWTGEVTGLIFESGLTTATVSRLSLPWGRVGTDLDGLAYKLHHQGNGFYQWPYLEVKGSPAKLLQGHNVFGPSDFKLCLASMCEVVASRLPDLWSMVDLDHAELRAIDLTASVSCGSESGKHAVLSGLKTLRRRHTRGYQPFETSVYLSSKSSRYIVRKVYDKKSELAVQAKRFASSPDRVDLLESLSKLHSVAAGLRWECRFKAQWFNRNGVSTLLFPRGEPGDLFRQLCDERSLVELFNVGFADAFEALKGEDLRVMSTEKISKLLFAEYSPTVARNLVSFYRNLEAYGFDQIKSDLPRSTFSRRVNQLRAVGISLAALQSCSSSTVVPLVRFMTVDWAEQIPPGYQAADYSDLARLKSQLAAVA